jgi:hypothetical protein
MMRMVGTEVGNFGADVVASFGQGIVAGGFLPCPLGGIGMDGLKCLYIVLKHGELSKIIEFRGPIHGAHPN